MKSSFNCFFERLFNVLFNRRRNHWRNRQCIYIVSLTLLSSVFFTLGCNKSVQDSVLNKQLTIAVSANFSKTFMALKTDLQAYCQCKINQTFGSSGVLANQMDKGAPFDIFMSADQEKPHWLFQRGKTSGKPITYVIGQLVLVDNHRKTLNVEQLGIPVDDEDDNWRIAIANAKTAPYGEAAEQVLSHLKRIHSPIIIRGNSVLQALQYFKTGNVDQAIISKSMLPQININNSAWVDIPAGLHEPIIQQMVVGKRSPVSLTNKVVEYFQLAKTQNKLKSWGYLPEGSL